MGCFLEFLYTGDYFPKKLPGQRTLEKDPSIPDVDMTGDQLLKHAKVYTLAEKFGLVHLKNLASSKIHCVNSTAKGEIAYARYIYEYTSKDDTSIRVPVANFWATRSHTLRSEAEEEFRALCLEFPQFGYDVLSMSPRIPPFLLHAQIVVVALTFCPPSQPASSTRSSSASATKRCTPAPPAARASGPATAAQPLRKPGSDRHTIREMHHHRARIRGAATRVLGPRLSIRRRRNTLVAALGGGQQPPDFLFPGDCVDRKPPALRSLVQYIAIFSGTFFSLRYVFQFILPLGAACWR